ncbi:183_t:CDS:2 [Funneliformis geosporum]|nr:183_t:CDS:2 [Funneliformis geosporum]
MVVAPRGEQNIIMPQVLVMSLGEITLLRLCKAMSPISLKIEKRWTLYDKLNTNLTSRNILRLNKFPERAIFDTTCYFSIFDV